MTRHRRALLITLASLTLWSFWNYERELCHPYADLACGVFTDHFSHVGLARVFTSVGTEIYDGPRGELGNELTPEERSALPPDLQPVLEARSIEGWPADKPYVSTWPTIPSFYPPGDMVMFAPVAIIYSFTDMSFTEMNRATIQLLLVYAHVTIFLILALYFGRAQPDGADALALVVAGYLILRWTIEGFYDGGWIAPLILTPVFLARRAALPAVTSFAVAAFTHFRALFYLPWAVQGFVEFLRGKQWHRWDGRKTIMAAATVVMGAASLWVFLSVADLMRDHTLSNTFNMRSDSFDRNHFASLLLVAIPGGMVFVWKRAWSELLMLAWVVVMVTQVPEIPYWDAVALVPWLVAPSWGANADPTARRARSVTAVLVMSAVFSMPFDPGWLRAVTGNVLG